MFKILTLNPISTVGLQQLPAGRYEVSNNLADPDAILVRSASMLTMVIPSTVLVVGRAGAGLNNIPVAELTKRGIPVLNTPGANANAVRELVLAGMLLASRNLCQAWNYVTHLQSQGEALEKEVEANKKQFVGFELMGKTIGVVGLGSVGVKVANAAISLGMRVIGYDPTITVNRAWELSANVQQAQNLQTLLQECDFISLHVPLTKDTKHMIDQASFKLTKPRAILLNFARDEIVETKALLAALAENKVSMYVTDFPTDELKNHPRVICLPHLGASTKEAEENCAVMVAKQVREFLEMGVITNAANFPTVELPALVAGVRIVMVNANVPNMVAQISTTLATAGINISSLVNKSRDDIAYTVIDVNNEVSDKVLVEIGRIPGIMHARKLIPVLNN